MAKEKEPQNGKNLKTFVLLDGSVTTYGFRVLVDGVDTSQFERNPVIFYNHNDYNLPIGKWGNIRKQEGRILADAYFDYADKNEEVQRIIGKVERDFIKMCSVGLRDNEWSDEDLYKIENQTMPTVIKSRLREASIAAIGGNHNAIRLYDNEDTPIDLSDQIKLSDFIRPYKQKKTMNEELLNLLELSDKADEKAVIAAIVALKDGLKTAKHHRDELQKKVDAMELSDKEAKKVKAVELVDAAIKDGRINADGEGKIRQSYLDLFDENFERGSNILAGLPARQSLAGQIANMNQGSKTELADLLARPWDELDKSGKLIALRDSYPDAYKDKYKEKFGVAPSL